MTSVTTPLSKRTDRVRGEGEMTRKDDQSEHIPEANSDETPGRFTPL